MHLRENDFIPVQLRERTEFSLIDITSSLP